MMISNFLHSFLAAAMLLSTFVAHAQVQLIQDNGDGAGELVGSVAVTDNGDSLDVAFTVEPPYLLLETHAAAARECAHIPQTGSGNPKVGKFEDQWQSPSNAGSDEIHLTLVDVYENSGSLCIAAHAVVYDTTAGETPEEALLNSMEGAWAGTEQFPGRNWATHFEFAYPSADSCEGKDHCFLFTSSEIYNGDLGGLIGADEKCNSLATAAGLAGQFKAWLSTDAVAAPERFTETAKPYKNIVGETVADNLAALSSHSLTVAPGTDESGTRKELPASGAWTGTTVEMSLGVACENWTSSNPADQGTVGNSIFPNLFWTQNLIDPTATCDAEQALYCLED